MSRPRNIRMFLGFAVVGLFIAAMACVTKEVPVEVIKEVVVEVERVVEKEVIKVVEVPVETIVEVEKEVIVTVVETEVVEVVKEVVVEVVKEVVVEVEKVVVVKQDISYPLAGSELIVAAVDVGPPLYKRNQAPEPTITYPYYFGMTENLVDYDGQRLLTPMLASEWTLDDVGVVFTIRNDVPWHNSDYGQFVTPEDIHFSFTEMTKTLNGWITEYYIPQWENQRVDGQQIKWDWAAGSTLTWAVPARHAGSAVQAENKSFFEEEGMETAITTALGTGPYKIIRHKADDLVDLEGVKNHWRIDPGFEKVSILEVPESTTRVAMLVSGDADITMVGTPMIDQIADVPGMQYHFAKFVRGTGATVHMGGNWRIRIDQLTGEPTISTYDDSLPWVGKLDDAEEMAKALLVRKAFTVAIDRDALNDSILGGTGCIAYGVMIDICSSRHKESWENPFDQDYARQLLAEGGYPDGFDLTVWIPSGDTNETFVEIGQAIVNMWGEVGIRAQIDGAGYAVRGNELAHGRQMNDVWLGDWGGPRVNFEVWTGYIACFDTTIEYSCGYDFPEAYDIHARLVNETEEEPAWEIITQFLDFVHDEYLSFSTVFWFDPYVGGPRLSPQSAMSSTGKNFPEIESFMPSLDWDW